MVVTPNSILSGYYYLDYDANGVFNGYDAPLAGQTLDLSSGSGSPVSAVTNQDGFYLFPERGAGVPGPSPRRILAAGNYLLPEHSGHPGRWLGQR